MTKPLPRQRSRPGPGGQKPWWRRLGSVGDRRTGAPPARSALGLRRVLALFGLLFAGAFAALAATEGRVAAAVVLGVIALTAVVDLVVIQRRIHRERR